MLSIAIAIIVIALIAGLIVYAVDYLNVPSPFNRIIKVGTVIVAIIMIIHRLLVFI